MELNKRLIKGGAVYSFGSIFQQALNFILIPIYTAYLSPEDFGIVGLMTITAGLILPFTKTPVANGFVRYYFAPGYEDNRKVLFFNSIVFALIQSFIMGLIFYLFSGLFSEIIFSDSNLGNIVKIYALIIFLQPLEDLAQDLIKLQKKAVLYVILQVSGFVLSAALIIYLFLIENFGVMSLVYGALFATCWPITFLMPQIIKNISAKLDLKKLKPLLIYGYPLILTVLSLYSVQFADQYILKYYCGVSAVGLYSFGYKFGMLICFFLAVPIHNIINPMILELEKDQFALRNFVRQSANYFYIVAIFLCLGLSLFSKELIELLARNEEFWPAWTIVPLIAFSSVHFGMMELFNKGIVISKKSVYNGISYLIAAVINIILNFLFIPEYGIMGAAAGTLISYLVLNVLLVYYSQKFYHLSFDLLKLLKITAIGVILYSVSLFFQDASIISLFIKTIILCLFPLILYFMKIFSSGEKELIRSLGTAIREGGPAAAVKTFANKFKQE